MCIVTTPTLSCLAFLCFLKCFLELCCVLCKMWCLHLVATILKHFVGGISNSLDCFNGERIVNEHLGISTTNN